MAKSPTRGIGLRMYRLATSNHNGRKKKTLRVYAKEWSFDRVAYDIWLAYAMKEAK